MVLDESTATERAFSNIESIISSNELPMFIDVGGLTLDNGCIPEYINKLIDKVSKSTDTHLILILTRRISYDNAVKVESIPVEQLNNRATSQLLSKLAERSKIVLKTEDNRDLTEYVNGYPPAANFAINQAAIYSVSALVRDKRKLTQFSQKRFITHIQDHNLDKSDIKVLQVLSGYSPLPLISLLALYSCSANVAHDKLYEMIDCSLIRVIDGQLYRIADPIKGSVNEVFGYANKEILSAVSEPLQKYVESSEDDHKLELSRVLFRIGFTLGDREATNKGIRLNSDYIKLLEYSYHQRNYKEAIELGLEAVKYCPDSTTARTFLIKALIQEEKWEAAQLQIDSLYPIDEYRNIYYLQGFLERKKGNITKAILALVDAEKHGRKGFALYREFSHCYLMNGDINNASRYIENALAIQPNNNQVIDMAARIAIKNHDEISAKRYIDQLELLDSSEHYNLRLSTFHLSFGRTSLALEAARNSVSAGGSRFLSGRVQLIKTLTKSRLFNEADTEVSSLNSDFSKSKNDIRIALQCSLDLEKDDVKSAFKILDGFIDKSSIQYKGIKKKCLEKLIKDVSIDYKTRQGYQSELKYLESICDYSLTDIES